METWSVKLPPDLASRVRAESERRKLGRSELVREALTVYLATEHNNRTPSCLDLARDIAGAVSGPADQATNKKHMKGYGR